MKKLLSAALLLFSIFLLSNSTAYAKELPNVSNYDYSIDMFTTTYYISYDLDGGTLDRINTYTPENDDFGIGIPTKDGYIFAGWTGSNGEHFGEMRVSGNWNDYPNAVYSLPFIIEIHNNE